jgi:hypothetical protein
MYFRIFPQLFEQPWVRGGCAILLAIGAVSGITLMQWQRLQRTALTTLNPKQQEQQEALYIRSLKYLPDQGFGFNNLIADWTFLRFLQYFGDFDARAATGYSVAPDFFELISQRDPRFIPIYIFSSGTLAYELGMPEESIKILDRGIAALDPKLQARAYTLWTLKALDQFLLLGDAAAAADSYHMAAQWAQQSPDPELQKEAPFLQQFSDFLKTDPDSRIVRFWAWTTVYNQAKATGNAKARGRARNELWLLGAVEGKNEAGQTMFRLPLPKPKPSPPPRSTPSPSPSAATQVSPSKPADRVPSATPTDRPAIENNTQPQVTQPTTSPPNPMPAPTAQANP